VFGFFGYYLYLFLKKRKYKITQGNFFKTKWWLIVETTIYIFWQRQNTKLFCADELLSATDNFNQSRILGRGGYGTVYKGMLLDGRLAKSSNERSFN
jgi:hypothetical protein